MTRSCSWWQVPACKARKGPETLLGNWHWRSPSWAWRCWNSMEELRVPEGGSLLTIHAFTPRGSLGLGREEKFSIPSNSTNQSGVGRKIFEQPSVGKASVDHHSQIVRVFGILLSVELVPQSGHPLESYKVIVGGGQV